MAYTAARARANKKYDDAHYKRVGVKIKNEDFAKMQECSRYQNNAQFINLLIAEEIERDALLKASQPPADQQADQEQQADHTTTPRQHWTT